MEVTQHARLVSLHVLQECRANVTCPRYFRDPGFLANLPGSMLTVGAVYTGLLVIGNVLAVEKPMVTHPPRNHFCFHLVRRQARRVFSEKDFGTPWYTWWARCLLRGTSTSFSSSGSSWWSSSLASSPTGRLFLFISRPTSFARGCSMSTVVTDLLVN